MILTDDIKKKLKEALPQGISIIRYWEESSGSSVPAAGGGFLKFSGTAAEGTGESKLLFNVESVRKGVERILSRQPMVGEAGNDTAANISLGIRIPQINLTVAGRSDIVQFLAELNQMLEPPESLENEQAASSKLSKHV